MPNRLSVLGEKVGKFCFLVIVFAALVFETEVGVAKTGDGAAEFASRNVVGTFVLFDSATKRITTVNDARARTQFVPGSTFKIANGLIALEVGAVAGVDDIIPYGGKPQEVKAWERDMSMREAIGMSNVPIFQELARRIGTEQYRDWLSRLDYGNRNANGVIDRFWLDGPLATSAIEQAQFVSRLARSELRLSYRSQALMREILKLETKGNKVLYGKTGWAQKIGWWTGWVDDNGRIAAFSLNIDMPSVEDAPKRIAIAKALLAKFGAY